jgi:hypothetical protein
MKDLTLLIFLLPITAIAQSKADYQNAMEKFQRLYNAGQCDSIRAMFQSSIQSASKANPLWTNDYCDEALKKFGVLKSFSFLGIDKTDPNNVFVFQTFFSKAGARSTSLTLNENAELGTFRFITTSEGIEKLLKKKKACR